MTTTVVVDGLTITFGDTSGDLTARAHGDDQDLTQAPVGSDVYVGDANAIVGQAVGGNDTVSALIPNLPIETEPVIAIGDAFTIGDRGRGGDDVVTAAAYQGTGTAYGDAETMTGSAVGGNDIVSVGAVFGSFVGYGDSEVLTNNAHGGDDTLSGSAGSHASVSIFGDARVMNGNATGGNDALAGSGLLFTESGDAETLSGSVHAGDDTLASTAYGSWLFGDGRTISENVQCGNDVLSALGPSAQLYGDGQGLSGNVQCGNDILSAPNALWGYDSSEFGDGQTIGGHVHCGDDTLTRSNHPTLPPVDIAVTTILYGDGYSLLDGAQGGNDVLISGAGNDRMWGDAAVVGPRATTGADRFVFSSPNGHDEIMDFQPGKDHIELDGFYGISSFEDLATPTHLQPTLDGVLISLDANDDILVHGVATNQLTASDFLFG